MGLRVDWRSSCSFVGSVVKWLSLALLLPLGTAFFYGNDPQPFLVTIVVALLGGFVLERLRPTDERELGLREGFLFVALTWAGISVVGAIPYLVAGNGTLATPVNALFESMSGFTTTGATVMGEISFDAHSRAIMLWRQQTQWLGGMGIIVLAVAILPELSVGGAQLIETEAPGPGLEKLTPRIAETARVLWGVYLLVTMLEAALLYALHLGGWAPNMTFYNAVAHALTTMPTGGFSPAARSAEAFSAAVQWVIIPFMVLAGTNFALVWHAVNGNFEEFRTDAEFRSYLLIVGVVSALTALLLFATPDLAQLERVGAVGQSVEPTVRHALFQIVSLVTTTGYASMDFNAWSDPAQYVLFGAMFIGASTGSTGGAVKIIRWVVIGKSIRRELFSLVHPSAVRPVRLGGSAIDERTIKGIYGFTMLYVLLFATATVVLLVDTARVGLSLSAFEAMTATASCIGNVGPAIGAFGPMNNYEALPPTSKSMLVFLMWIGRLEIFPVLVLLTGAYWRS
jgi:trk system potassium uptake protein TrkH